MTTDQTHSLSVQHADALWDAVAIPGPCTPTFTEQHERVCAAVAEIIDDVTAVGEPEPEQDARDRIAEALDSLQGTAHHLPFGTRQRVIEVVTAAVLPPPVPRANVLREAAVELGRMDYDTDSNDYGYDTYRDAWNGGVMDGAEKLRRMADEAQPGTEAPADVEHCVHDRAIHQRHHLTPVTGCPWCAASVEARS